MEFERPATKRLVKRLFPLFATLLLAPWPVAYAYDIDVVEQEPVMVRAAEPAEMPHWPVFSGALGSVGTGTLFYIDAAGRPADIEATLHLTNAGELIGSYRYLFLEVGVYVQTAAGGWEKADQRGGTPLAETWLTLRNGQVSFTLAGYSSYKITIDGGSYCSTRADGDISPRFYLAVENN